MKKTSFILIIFFSSFVTTFAHSNIAYIDINFILNKSELGKSLNKHIQEINSKNTKNLKKLENNLMNKEKLLLSQKNILEKKEFDSRLNILSLEIQKYRSDKKILQDELNRIKIKNSKKILELLNPIITDFVEKNSISLVIPKKNIIVGKKKLDITDKIIELLNNQKYSLSF